MILQLAVCIKAVLITEVIRKWLRHISFSHLYLSYRVFLLSTDVYVNSEYHFRLYIRLWLLPGARVNYLRYLLLNELPVEELVYVPLYQLKQLLFELLILNSEFIAEFVSKRYCIALVTFSD
jgi:hypothetical protein